MFYNMQLSSPPFSVVIYSFLTAQMDAAPSATSSESPLSHKFQSVGNLMKMNLKDYLKRVLKCVVWSVSFEARRLIQCFSCLLCRVSRVLRKSHTKTMRTMFYARFTPCGGRIMTDRTSDSLPRRYPQEIFAKHSPSLSQTHTHTLIHTHFPSGHVI